MRVAIYHNLPPGGALRVLAEFVRRTCDENDYELYTLDLGRFDPFAYARGRAEQHDLTPWVGRVHRYPVVPAAVSRAVPRGAWVLSQIGWMDRIQRRIAADIDAGGYDVALVYSCQLTHTPWLLTHLEGPSLHYMNEPRRRSFEAGYQAIAPRSSWARRAVAGQIERALRARDIGAATATDRIVTNSCYSAESIRRAYGRDAGVCPLGIDTSTFDLGGRQRPGPARVISVGALERTKGHDLIVRALCLLPATTRPELDLVYERCDPAYRAEVEGLAAEGGVSLRLHAGIPDAELAGLYRAAAAALVAARLEPFGLVPLEAMACGTPAVAVREAGYRETVVDGVNGYLVDRSAPALADAVCRVLAGGLGRTPAEIRATVAPRWDWDGAAKHQQEELAITAGLGA